MRTKSPLLLVGFVLAGCGAGDGSPDAVIEIDSAGVSVVRLGAQMIDSAPVLTLSELFRVGTKDGPEETRFFRLATAQESNGEVFSLDVGDHQVRVFSGDGVFLRHSVGREVARESSGDPIPSMWSGTPLLFRGNA